MRGRRKRKAIWLLKDIIPEEVSLADVPAVHEFVILKRKEGKSMAGKEQIQQALEALREIDLESLPEDQQRRLRLILANLESFARVAKTGEEPGPELEEESEELSDEDLAEFALVELEEEVEKIGRAISKEIADKLRSIMHTLASILAAAGYGYYYRYRGRKYPRGYYYYYGDKAPERYYYRAKAPAEKGETDKKECPEEKEKEYYRYYGKLKKELEGFDIKAMEEAISSGALRPEEISEVLKNLDTIRKEVEASA